MDRRSATPEELPPLTLSVLRELDLDAPPGPASRAHISAGSGVARRGDFVVFARPALRVITWNVARRSSRLAEQAAALASREPDVVALQEITDTTLPLWRAVLERKGLPTSEHPLDTADPARTPARRRRTGVLLGSSEALRDPSATLPVPWAETAVAALAATAIGPSKFTASTSPTRRTAG